MNLTRWYKTAVLLYVYLQFFYLIMLFYSCIVRFVPAVWTSYVYSRLLCRHAKFHPKKSTSAELSLSIHSMAAMESPDSDAMTAPCKYQISIRYLNPQLIYVYTSINQQAYILATVQINTASCYHSSLWYTKDYTQLSNRLIAGFIYFTNDVTWER